VCWKQCSSCWSFHLLREEFLSAPIHSPPSLVRRIGPSVFIVIVVRVKTFESTLVSVIKVHKSFMYVLSNVL
jgi:hypothetical protein